MPGSCRARWGKSPWHRSTCACGNPLAVRIWSSGTTHRRRVPPMPFSRQPFRRSRFPRSLRRRSTARFLPRSRRCRSLVRCSTNRTAPGPWWVCVHPIGRLPTPRSRGRGRCISPRQGRQPQLGRRGRTGTAGLKAWRRRVPDGSSGRASVTGRDTRRRSAFRPVGLAPGFRIHPECTYGADRGSRTGTHVGCGGRPRSRTGIGIVAARSHRRTRRRDGYLRLGLWSASRLEGTPDRNGNWGGRAARDHRRGSTPPALRSLRREILATSRRRSCCSRFLPRLIGTCCFAASGAASSSRWSSRFGGSMSC